MSSNPTTVKCFACDRPIKDDGGYLVGCADEQDVAVGHECFRKIIDAGEQGYQPPKGGPRLYRLDVAYQMRRDARTAAKPTPGPYTLVHRELDSAIYSHSADGLMIVQVHQSRKRGLIADARKANAELANEAFTVHHETGLTPQQLREQRDELLRAAKHTLSKVDADGQSPDWEWLRATVLCAEAQS